MNELTLDTIKNRAAQVGWTLKEDRHQDTTDKHLLVFQVNDTYELRMATASYRPGGYDLEVRCDRHQEYAARIYMEDTLIGNEIGPYKAKVQTTSYGALETEELDKMVAGLQAAKDAAHKIQSLFPEFFE